MASTLISMPKGLSRNQVIQIRCLVAHPMESGFRPGADGRILPADLIRQFRVVFVGPDSEREVFSADFFSAVAANPYVSFFFRVPGAGSLRFVWQGDQGFIHTETQALDLI
jgi:sulfur-oxidizing protein SoxZ